MCVCERLCGGGKEIKGGGAGGRGKGGVGGLYLGVESEI